jgi:hypothetical protein
MKSLLRLGVIVGTVALTVVVLMSLPYEGFNWATAQVYEVDQSPTSGGGFLYLNEVVSGGSSVNLGNAGTGILGNGDVLSLLTPSGGLAANVSPQSIVAGFQQYLQTGLLIPPSSQFITNPEARRVMTQPYLGGEVRGYYLFTTEGTSVFQFNIYQNGTLANDRLMLFVAPNGSTVWVYRAE